MKLYNVFRRRVMKKNFQMKVINTYSIRKCNIGVASFII
ncbi:TPA: YSIRK-type signal peptide-containing protein, partial [Staphylococcus aureus]|nr:YSIRK-type signal peptide-containing protein [Staphylococcus aureus]